MKSGLDYFPMDCRVSDSVRLIEAKFGLCGFAVVVKLWQDIYGENGYYKNFDDDCLALFALETGTEESMLKEILKLALEKDIFDKNLYHKYKILSSKEIQECFLKCTRKRKYREIEGKLLLLNSEDDENDLKNGVKNQKKGGSFQQSKVKESKVKESKGEESKENNIAPAPDIKEPYGDYKNVLLSKKEYDLLSEELGRDKLLYYIKKIDEYIEETGKRYNNHALTVRRWNEEDTAAKSRSPSVRTVKKSKFNNYTDDAKPDYKKIEERILREMLEE